MYKSGEGVPQDYAEAFFWTSPAAASETRPAKRDRLGEWRDVVGSHLDEKVLLQTQQRVHKWRKEHPLNP